MSRAFTLGEANRTLPLVRRIVEDLARAHEAMQEDVERFQRMLSVTGPNDDPARLDEMRERINRASEGAQTLVDELEQIGCEFKGFELGLVDFRAYLDGRPILLCWKLGEEEIRWWHEPDAGYAGRKLITPPVAERVRSEPL